MVSDWVEMSTDAGHVARERARARSLRASPWWRSQLAAGRCHYCGAAVPSAALTMDHIIPVARGGRSVRGNVVPACTACNRTKRFLTPAEQVLAELDTLRRRPLPGGGEIYTRGGQAVLIDPVDAQAALACIRDEGLALHAILLTHDPSETAAEGCEHIRDATGCLVMGTSVCTATHLDRELQDGEHLHTPAGGFTVATRLDGSPTFNPDPADPS